ncbi:ethanolamine ammonia-lyase subunit EutB [Hungatella sp.]
MWRGSQPLLFEGLSYGCGDVLIGLNPVNDTVSSLAEVFKAV